VTRRSKSIGSLVSGKTLRGILRRALPFALGGVVLGIAAFATLPRLFPLELPSLKEPLLIYARPHRVSVNQDIESSRLVDRLARLGYRKVDGNPEPGQFRVADGRLVLNRRAFRTPAASGEARRVEMRVAKGRITSMVDREGEPVPSLVIEPEVIGELHSQERELRDALPLDEIPPLLVRSVIALEDRRFYAHAGFDLHGFVGAMLDNVKCMCWKRGGSTLTQQLVKNVYLNADRTIGRKAKEAWYALRVEATSDKQRILETYLNTIYLGQRGSVSIRGVEAASRHYFGKSAKELSVGQSALLAGMIPNPGKFSPYASEDGAAARKRRDDVLGILMRAGVITAEEHAAAMKESLGKLAKPPRPAQAPYFAAWIERQLSQTQPDPEALRSSGVSVITELDASLQILAEEAIEEGVKRIEAASPKLRREDSPLQAALIALDPHTGDVLAHVGGRNYAANQFDHATQALRQPGSTFKPIALLAAVSEPPDGGPRFTLASRLEDTPMEGKWKPTNYDGDYHGIMTLRRSIERSLNVPLARVALAIGPQRIVDTARKLGIDSRLDPVPSIALGSFEVTMLEIARAYAVFASGGMRTVPRPYARVLDRDGQLIESRKVVSEQVFPAGEVAIVTSALQGTVERGTAAGVRRAGFRGPLAAKTGTTNDYRDAWFVGYTPDLVVAVWVGFDDGQPLGLASSATALPIFADFIKGALGADGGRGFPMPEGLEYVEIEPETGLRAGWSCRGDGELFLIGTAPTERCQPRVAPRNPQVASTPEAEAAENRPSGQKKTEKRRSVIGGFWDTIGGIFGR